MKERPVILRPREVEAVLDGKKTQLRTPVQPALDRFSHPDLRADGEWQIMRDVYTMDGNVTQEYEPLKCPYGKIGDRLWARETYLIYQTINYSYSCNGGPTSIRSDMEYAYRADGFDSVEDFKQHMMLVSDPPVEWVYVKDNKWRSPLFMPRKASRLTLEITDIRLERVQEISYEDAVAEHAPPVEYYPTRLCNPAFADDVNYFWGFSMQWDEKYKKKGFAWAHDPWAWAISFKIFREKRISPWRERVIRTGFNPKHTFFALDIP